MKRVLAAVVLSLFCLSPAFAETLRAELNDGIIVQLSDTPCKNGKILHEIEKAYAPTGKKPPALAEGWASFPGKPKRHGCWAINPALDVVLIYEDGSAGIIPLLAFAPVPEVKI